MKAVDRHQFRLVNKKRRFPRWAKLSLFGFGGFVVVFLVANIIMGLVYRNKVLPNYSVAAIPIGNIPFDQLNKRVAVERLLPQKVALKKDDVSKDVAPKDLGVTVDWTTTLQNIKKSRSWLPVTSLFLKRSVPAELTLDNGKFATSTKELETVFAKAALPERVAFQGDNFAIAAPEDGYQLDVVELRQSLVHLLEQGKAELPVPTTLTHSTEPTGKLQGELSALQKLLDVKVTFTAGGEEKQLSRAQIAGFFEASGQTLKISETKMAQVVSGAAQGLDIAAVNQDEAVQAALYAMSKRQPITFRFAAHGAKINHYCVAAKGVSASVLPEYRQKLAAVYGDPRGWNNGGEQVFVYADSGCDYTAWLSSPADMTGFSSAICDNYYSCRVGPNVIVNYDRWMGATDPWNAAGGSLEDYRVMVINHETGHWLGFNHRNCVGAGQPAPVMQQQSIDLQGCTFNPWPTAAELAVL